MPLDRSRLARDILESLFQRWRRPVAGKGAPGVAAVPADAPLIDRAAALLEERSQSSGVHLAAGILADYAACDDAGRHAFLRALATRFAPDPQAIRAALDAHDADPSPARLSAVTRAAEAPRQEVLRRLNQAPAGTAALVAMRADLLRHLPQDPMLAPLEDDLVHLLRSWFNRGFLVLRRIDWSSPADLLERIIRYEAVHSIATWDDLRARLLPADRRCYGFFHPALGDEPLIFVEVALCAQVPDSIGALLAQDRAVLDPQAARVAVFYSISNCQAGLAGISFGQFLIKQVVEDLGAEFPGLESYVTLSPIPGFARWLRDAAAKGDAAAGQALAQGAPDAGWAGDDPRRHALMRLGARYLLAERDGRGRLRDPVARFHVGNGARVERLCWLADTSPRGMKQSLGLMVNYLYDLASVEANHNAYARHRVVNASGAMHALLAPERHTHAKLVLPAA
ncbi:malonyl-CoA decarboxylase [Novosphingobium capsulatum]|uniref:malonyl-CoA decarboxylase n=1 Tax=Novosphingobium capsulatum TaxID=13688 RepID=UPI000788A0EB|nr:malonyl-CoA decarboxylase [Novosphingobium capsulatum]WQD95182.1 malonyl-CoA decarboxylase [Novosphingobium capsulatum]